MMKVILRNDVDGLGRKRSLRDARIHLVYFNASILVIFRRNPERITLQPHVGVAGNERDLAHHPTLQVQHTGQNAIVVRVRPPGNVSLLVGAEVDPEGAALLTHHDAITK